MPMLQLDGEDIAEIDERIAAQLRNGFSKHGVGRTPRASFRTAILDRMPARFPDKIQVLVDLEFVEKL